MNIANLDLLARDLYYANAERPDVPWEELPEWIRESWRQEIDPERDPDLIRTLAAAENWATEQATKERER